MKDIKWYRLFCSYQNDFDASRVLQFEFLEPFKPQFDNLRTKLIWILKRFAFEIIPKFCSIRSLIEHFITNILHEFQNQTIWNPINFGQFSKLKMLASNSNWKLSWWNLYLTIYWDTRSCKGKLERTRNWKVWSWRISLKLERAKRSRKESIEVGKFELKLESSGWSWKVQLKLESDLWSWEVEIELGKTQWSWKAAIELGKIKRSWKVRLL